MKVAPKDVIGAKVRLTVLGGEVVYRRADFSPAHIELGTMS